MTSNRNNHFIFYLLLILPTLPQALNTDGVTLLSFKYSILNDPLSVLRNWNYDDETPCSWTGITCTEVGNPPETFRVTSLVLPSTQLLGSVSLSLLSIQHLRILDLSNNFFDGSLPDSISNASQLRVLNLSANAITGKIPKNLSLLKNLTVLDISSNLLDGSLPPDFEGTSLHYLNLSHNQISGVISPVFAEKVSPSAIVDLSFNNLTGPIPSTPTMLNQKTESFSGNLGLCGQPLKTLCSIPSTLSEPQNITDTTSPAIAVMPRTSTQPKAFTESTNQTAKSKLKPITIVGITVADITGLAIIAMFILYIYQIRKRRSYQEYSTFNVLKECLEKNDTSSVKKSTKSPEAKTGWGSCIIGSYEETSSATSESDIEKQIQDQKTIEAFNRTDGERLKHSSETQLVTVDGETQLDLDTLLKASAYVLGTSRRGIVYKAVLQNGVSFAVRRIGAESCTAANYREFERKVQEIAKIRHPNLVRVRGFVWGNEEKLLISDYLPNGSLLHCSSIYGSSSSTFLQSTFSFEVRLKIARGIARGIAYMHDKKHVHGNIKPNNILLDFEFEPIIINMGLDRLMNRAHLHAVGPKSSTPHHPPERSTTTSHKPNPKWDVYSFGVILLELLTGRIFLNGDFIRDREVDERSWFLRLVDGAIRAEVAHHEDDAVVCFRLGYGCVNSLPQKRPSMKEVVQVLEKISV